MVQKTESILIRVSKELSDNIEHWIQKTGKKKSTLIREAIRSHLKQLERDDPEVKEVIRAIIISKLDRIQKEFDQGRIVIIQYTDETRIDAINRHAQILYDEWRRLPDDKRDTFMNDLHQDHVYFSMKPRAI